VSFKKQAFPVEHFCNKISSVTARQTIQMAGRGYRKDVESQDNSGACGYGSTPKVGVWLQQIF